MRPVCLVRANLVFVGTRYKHLEYKASEVSAFYTTEPNSLRAAYPAEALSARTHIQFPTLGKLQSGLILLRLVIEGSTYGRLGRLQCTRRLNR